MVVRPRRRPPRAGEPPGTGRRDAAWRRPPFGLAAPRSAGGRRSVAAPSVATIGSAREPFAGPGTSGTTPTGSGRDAAGGAHAPPAHVLSEPGMAAAMGARPGVQRHRMALQGLQISRQEQVVLVVGTQPAAVSLGGREVAGQEVVLLEVFGANGHVRLLLSFRVDVPRNPGANRRIPTKGDNSTFPGPASNAGRGSSRLAGPGKLRRTCPRCARSCGATSSRCAPARPW